MLSALPTPMLLPRCTGLTMQGNSIFASSFLSDSAEGSPPAARDTTA